MAALESRVSNAKFLLLGERHDHPDHHLLQARLLELWLAHQMAQVSSKSPPAVVFEMLDQDQAPALASFVESGSRDALDLAKGVSWDKSGWPTFGMYKPVFDSVLRGGGTATAGHPSRSVVSAAMMAEDRPTAEEPDLQLSEPLAPELEAALAEEIRAAHCGHASPKMVAMMTRAQHLKDAYLARAMGTSSPAALIAGNGHVRSDRGVPHFLRLHGVKDSLSVAFVEVVHGKNQPTDYGLDGLAKLVVFTPRVDEVSPCEAFREQLRKLGRHNRKPGTRRGQTHKPAP